MAEVKIGYLLPTRDRAAGDDDDLAGLIEHARHADALGFDSVWTGDSPLTRPRADPLLLMSAVTVAAPRLTLGTAMMLPALRHPILMAHQLATLDRLAGGRLIVGMGAGFPTHGTEAQFDAIGVPFRTRFSRLEESIEVMRRLWSGKGVSFTGRHFDFREVTIAPSPARPGGPPIWLAGSGESSLRRVAHLGDGWLPYPPDVADYARERAAVHGLAPRPVTAALYATVCLDDDPQRARKLLRKSIERYYNAPLEMVEKIQAMFAGPPAGAATWLNRYIGAGARHLVIRLAADDHHAALERFAAHVVPLLDV
ncbi:LLM class flavin-dependent oxidoreductase [Actinomadura mexicana]|uniref:Flavin-dependent oxidoreductase, luciferase family (Includes alkanesulfonate monooxygenase SsuD and methylene tetrahydromethanopterin reductase) n=1 Tax=Actinomadura mexicana TaxID=134959 RepID=A0A238X830_9ACTN|nr:LLM class flavin-dependent oxidoreductase [Actinomadura mexicana]SNR55205.1 Flavin-dependent oxidoreductase, luciferase family (includes alkanesulfonate monooxygenase SsuD and methylene tetrahydromethanopterin reductase) [Actinomadura mexicana]